MATFIPRPIVDTNVIISRGLIFSWFIRFRRRRRWRWRRPVDGLTIMSTSINCITIVFFDVMKRIATFTEVVTILVPSTILDTNRSISIQVAVIFLNITWNGCVVTHIIPVFMVRTATAIQNIHILSLIAIVGKDPIANSSITKCVFMETVCSATSAPIFGTSCKVSRIHLVAVVLISTGKFWLCGACATSRCGRTT